MILDGRMVEQLNEEEIHTYSDGNIALKSTKDIFFSFAVG